MFRKRKLSGWFTITALAFVISLVVGVFLYFRLLSTKETESEYLSAPKCYEGSRCREVVDVVVVDVSASRYTTNGTGWKETPSEVTVSAYSLDVVRENGRTLKLEIPLEAPAEKIALHYEGVNILAYPDKNFIRDNFSNEMYAKMEMWDGEATYIIVPSWAIPTFSHPTIVARKTEENFRDRIVFSGILIALLLSVSFGIE